eukprot:gnl/TRDRNA2_/TRDRNA2_172797_c2_seq2.p2 gnl/TRDRNA2_/TRDRNA2_172797_c2~~gnl/TRDRNA2_/TRDRNA2_172797_c2_seq2.p2  ORF type:complete len:105 (+),score=9.47 gnl/TRDRNA2_/TRDRNA2_172797_c2_seq2:317-631(+)
MHGDMVLASKNAKNPVKRLADTKEQQQGNTPPSFKPNALKIRTYFLQDSVIRAFTNYNARECTQAFESAEVNRSELQQSSMILRWSFAKLRSQSARLQVQLTEK